VRAACLQGSCETSGRGSIPQAARPGIRGPRAFVISSKPMKTAVALLLTAQLVAPNITIPQVMSAKFSTAAPIKAGRKGNVTVAFNLTKGYKINREPTITLELTPPAGVTLAEKSIDASPIDKKSKDEYYVDLPTLNVGVTAAKAGRYEVPGKLIYFFCSTSDGFCSKQTVDVKMPLQVE
jgi:hypothetical protein